MAIDWENVRRNRWAPDEPPPEWPKGIHAISLEGLTLLGLDERGRLYWDGKRVLIQRRVALGPFERWIAAVAALATVASAAADWWPHLKL